MHDHFRIEIGDLGRAHVTSLKRVNVEAIVALAVGDDEKLYLCLYLKLTREFQILLIKNAYRDDPGRRHAVNLGGSHLPIAG